MGVPLFTGESLSPIVFARLRMLLCLPCGKFLLPFLALIESENIRHQASGDVFDHMLRNSGIVDEFFASTQEFLLRMLVVEFEGVLGVFGVCVRHQSFLFVI